MNYSLLNVKLQWFMLHNIDYLSNSVIHDRKMCELANVKECLKLTKQTLNHSPAIKNTMFISR